jgi:hypothetical protein
VELEAALVLVILVELVEQQQTGRLAVAVVARQALEEMVF